MWIGGKKEINNYGWELVQKDPTILKETNDMAKKYLFKIKFNLEKYNNQYKKILKESNKIIVDNKPLNTYLPEYSITKQKYLYKFFNQCKNNENIEQENFYYKWIKNSHRLNEPQKNKKFNISFNKNDNERRKYFVWVRNKKDAIELSKRYRKHFLDIQKNGFYQPLYVQRAKLQLPGITDCTHRYAILRVLDYKEITLLVNKGTYNFMKKYDLIL